MSKKFYSFLGLILVTCILTISQVSAQYCTPGYSSGCNFGDEIDDFYWYGANDTISQPLTGCSTNAYDDYTATVPPLEMYQGQTYSGELTVGYTNQYIGVYIDTNQNNIFDSNELFTDFNVPTVGLLTPFSVSIPLGLDSGTYRVRFRGVWNISTPPDPCNNYSYGETHDYLIKVLLLPPCSGTPTAGMLVPSDSSVCGATPVSLDITGNTVAGGIGIVYYKGASATGPWTVMNTDSTLTSIMDTPLTTTYYYAEVFCGTASASTPVESIAVPTLFPAGTYTIDQTGTTGGTNFASIADAVDAIACGTSGPVVFNVVAGTGPYTEQMILPSVNTNSATNTITFNGNGETLDPVLSSTQPGAVTFLDADYFVVNDFVISPTGTAAWGVHFQGDADNNELTDCEINVSTGSTSTSYNGIIMSETNSYWTSSQADSNLIEGNTITGGYYGVRCYGGFSDPIYNNQIIDNEILDFRYYGLYSSYNMDIMAKGNVIGRPTRTSVATGYSVYSYYCTGLYEANHVQDCFAAATTSSSSFYGLYAYKSTSDSLPVTFVNNIVDQQSAGGSSYGMYVAGNHVQMYHNTVNVGSATSTNSSSKYGLYFSGNPSVSPVVSNNIFYVSHPSATSGTKYGVYHSTTGSSLDGGNNWFYLDSANSTNGYRANGVVHSTLSDYQSATSSQGTSIVLDPMYVSAPTDYTPTAFAFDNYGQPLGVAEDFNGMTRGGSPDVGAIEFSAPPCTSPPTAGATVVGDTVICQGFMTSFALDGNSYGSGQTYTWGWAPSTTGTWAALDTPVASPVGLHTVDSSGYYNCMVICGTDTAYSTPVYIQTNPPLAAGTYTIDQTSTTADFQSFGEAVDALSCGITGPVEFDVVSGTGPYNEQVVIPEVVGSSATNTITFTGNGNVLNFDTPTVAMRAVLTLMGTDNVTIDDLTITTFGGSSGGAGIIMTSGADNNTISNCVVMVDSTSTSTSSFGIALTGSTSYATTSGNNGINNTIENNTVVGGYYGIVNYGSFTVSTTGNKILNNEVREFYYNGIRSYYIMDHEVIGNDVSSPARTNGFSKYGIYNYYGRGGLNVSDNTVHNIHDANSSSTSSLYGYYFSSCDADSSNPNRVYNNELTNVNHSGGAFGLYNFSSDYTYMYHNTIMYDNPFSGSSTGTMYGIYNTSTTLSEYKNNLVVLSETGGHTKYGLYYSATPASSDHNDVWYPTTVTGANYGYSGGAQATLAAFQTAAGTDSFSIAGDPMIIPFSMDVTPLNTAINNLGTPVGVNKDHEGNFRSTTTPDIGSREFPICNLSNVAITASATSMCAGDTSVILTAPSGTSMTYQWQEGGADIAGETGMTFMPMMSGDYTVVIDSAGCIASQDTPTVITVHDLPLVDGGSDMTECDASMITLSGMGADTYTWDNGVLDGVPFTLSGTTTYVVTGQDTTTGCTNTDTVIVDALPLPMADAGADQLACDGDMVTLMGTGGDSLYWDNGVVDGIAFTPTSSGNYVLTTVDDSTGCMNMDTVMITVNTAPTVTTINYTSTSLLGFDFTSDASGATRYEWDFGDGSMDSVASPSYTYGSAGMQQVTLTVYNDCGEASVSIEIPVSIQDITSESGISIYPNPTRGQFTIESTRGKDIKNLRMLNVLGEEVQVNVKVYSGTESKVDMQGVSAGVYTLLLETKDGIYKQVINLIN